MHRARIIAAIVGAFAIVATVWVGVAGSPAAARRNKAKVYRCIGEQFSAAVVYVHVHNTSSKAINVIETRRT
jgi:hypothetical protein